MLRKSSRVRASLGLECPRALALPMLQGMSPHLHQTIVESVSQQGSADCCLATDCPVRVLEANHDGRNDRLVLLGTHMGEGTEGSLARGRVDVLNVLEDG
jgi:hypothetical protein